ncbi:hypothetical protein SMD22_00340 (plasmid) [Brevibacillus halotolerans]|nr:hypothetical protein SMD22_00340 [Brevibacillus halotolerans]
MLLNGNTFINGDIQTGMRLLEGIREFDMILLSSTTLTIDGTSTVKQLVKTLTVNGKFGVRIEPSTSLLMISNLLKAYGIGLIGRSVDESGQMWAFFERKGDQREGGVETSKSVISYVHPALSILCIGEEIEKTVKTLLARNHEDKKSRTFVIMYDGEDSIIYENVKKYSLIYETPLERIILEAPDLTTVA